MICWAVGMSQEVRVSSAPRLTWFVDEHVAQQGVLAWVWMRKAAKLEWEKEDVCWICLGCVVIIVVVDI